MKECLVESGVMPLMIDFSVLADQPFNPDISARDVARAKEVDFAELPSCHTGDAARAVALEVTTKGLIVLH